MELDAEMSDAPYWQATPEAMKEKLIEFIRQHQMRDAIHLYQSHHDAGLGDTKIALGRLSRLIFPPPPTRPCPACGSPLRTDLARQCLECGADWH